MVGVAPPKDNANEVVPAPPLPVLAVPKELTVVQLVPLYSSVAPVIGEAFPPKAKVAV